MTESPSRTPPEPSPSPNPPGAISLGPIRPKRAIPRQATSAVAHFAPPPAEDDPLLGFAPVLHVAPRRNSITPDRQRAFISHLAATGIVKQAALHIGASLEALYKLRNRPGGEGFAGAWDMALDRGVARLEDCALARAIAGEERMVVSAGKVLGTETRHNEALVMFFLRNRRAQRYEPDWRSAGPGHPLYDRVREELAEEFAGTLSEALAAQDDEHGRVLESIDEEWRTRLRERDEWDEEWEEDQDRKAEEAEAAKTPDERQREGLLYALQRWSLEDLETKVKW